MSTGTYLDLLDADLDEEVNPVSEEVVVAGPPPVLGVPVDLERHAEAFKRKSYGIHRVPGTPEFIAHERTWSWPAPPQVTCRDATAEEIPDEAAKAATNARNNGWPVRVTFAQGAPRGVAPNKGRCRCGAVVRLYKETGKVFEHAIPVPEEKVPCDGTVLNEFGACDRCGTKAKVLKKGGLARHYLKPVKAMCDNDEYPDEVIPGAALPGSCSVAVRVKGLGVAVWVDGASKGAWLRCDTEPATVTDPEDGRMHQVTMFTPNPTGSTWGPVPAEAFQAACARRKPVTPP